MCDGPIKMVVFGCWENKIIVIGRRSKVEWKVRECLNGSEVVDDDVDFPRSGVKVQCICFGCGQSLKTIHTPYAKT